MSAYFNECSECSVMCGSILSDRWNLSLNMLLHIWDDDKSLERIPGYNIYWVETLAICDLLMTSTCWQDSTKCWPYWKLCHVPSSRRVRDPSYSYLGVLFLYLPRRFVAESMKQTQNALSLIYSNTRPSRKSARPERIYKVITRTI